ncbi:polysaccharide deacetylase family protein [Legionella bononiensis]|uniref:Polysaccharide deacetylase family protein n=1 Tax=Legionella bononiensis TaxID=2793102 RepID=A0ABS1WCC7_9GAMM|nr:polysaccharide deacetylase family protein [Legionella bononiensis]MBL7478870.1 polysaccharide deacetylase family protein [Legionella bononiensis]MBL7527000.1 polysaccharide deacetylase family protein [Legionella bononiensis]MBL7562406.1 polysaccharide deacetylase family protein [Legionella bononiensis]
MTRDLVGYGNKQFAFEWPDKARLAINFVINYEEGAELSPVNGDNEAEQYGCDFPFGKKTKGKRNFSVESYYEYGSRVGIWRLTDLFDHHQIPLTFFVTGYALILNPLFSNYLAKSIHEVAGHGWRWIDYSKINKNTEQKHIYRCIETLEQLTGQRPQGWYTGRRSKNTRDLLVDMGGFIYDSDSYADDLPYKIKEHLVIPYSLDCNDFRFTTTPGFSTSNDFFNQLKSTFDVLYHENKPSLMTIGLHPRISGKPGPSGAVKQFLSYIQDYEGLWITKRIDIARYWLSQNQ